MRGELVAAAAARARTHEHTTHARAHAHLGLGVDERLDAFKDVELAQVLDRRVELLLLLLGVFRGGGSGVCARA